MQTHLYAHQAAISLDSIFPTFFFRGDRRKSRFRELRTFRPLNRIPCPVLVFLTAIWIYEGYFDLAVILGRGAPPSRCRCEITAQRFTL